MDIAPFALERWFAEHEADSDIMLAESGIASRPAADFDLDPGPLDYVIPTAGAPDLRSRLGKRCGRDGAEVLCTCGTQEANLLVFLGLLGGDAHAVVVTPSYGSLTGLPAALGSTTTVALDPPDWRLDPDAVADAIRPETALIVLANPNNPTGRYHPWETVERLHDIAEAADAYLLCDEVYRLLAEDPHPPVATLPRGITTTGLTKAFGLAGLRFGWLAGPEPVVEAATRWKDYTTISPPLIGQHVARQVLDREAELLEEHRALARSNRQRVAAFVDDYGLSWLEPVGVNGFVTVPEPFEDGRHFCERVVAEASVVLAPGEAFDQPGYFRLGFGLPTGDLLEGLDRVGSVIDRVA